MSESRARLLARRARVSIKSALGSSFGAIEGPEYVGVDPDGTIEVKGWCLRRPRATGGNGREEVGVLLDGERIGCVPWGHERADVGTKYPFWNGSSRAGFKGRVAVGGRRGPGRLSVEVAEGRAERLHRDVEFEDARTLSVLIDFTSRCNLKCIMCHFSLPGRDQLRDEISIEEFERLAPQLLPQVTNLGLSCSTEPFMFPDFLKALPIVRKYHVPFVWFVTNATMLKDEAIEEIVRAKVDSIQLSLDGATKETFERIRKNANFDKVLANIRRLRDKKIELGSDLPKLQFNVTLMRSNIEELEDILRLVAELGGSEVDLRHVVPYDGLESCELTLFEHKELTNRQLDRARSLVAELGLELTQCPDNFAVEPVPAPAAAPAKATPAEAGLQAPRAEDGAPPVEPVHLRGTCRMPWSMMVIHADGRVVPCTNWFTHEAMGNVKQQSIDEIWSGPHYERLREEMTTGRLGPNCRVCPAMGVGSVDREESFRVRKV